MSNAPAFMFYASDFLTKTVLWSEAEVAVHVRLLAWSWVNGGLPFDVDRLSRISPSAKEAWPTVGELWPMSTDGLRRNPELEKYRAERQEFLRLQKEKSDKASAKRRFEPVELPTGTPTGPSPDPPIMKKKTEEEEEVEEEVEVEGGKVKSEKVHEAILWPSFDDWWTLYDKAIGRSVCEAKWSRLPQSTREAIMRHSERYVPSEPDKHYRKHPATYLNQKAWLDEVITTRANPKTQSDEQRKRELAAEAFRRFGQPT